MEVIKRLTSQTPGYAHFYMLGSFPPQEQNSHAPPKVYSLSELMEVWSFSRGGPIPSCGGLISGRVDTIPEPGDKKLRMVRRCRGSCRARYQAAAQASTLNDKAICETVTRKVV